MNWKKLASNILQKVENDSETKYSALGGDRSAEVNVVTLLKSFTFTTKNHNKLELSQ